MFPNQVHQIWFNFSDNLHAENHELIHDTRCMVINSGAVYTLWTLNEATSFIQTHYPYLLHFFRTPMKYDIVKCDLFRYVLMYHFGGMYIDIDFVLVRPINEIFHEQTTDIVLFEEWYDSCKKDSDGTDGSLHNGCLISKPKQPFWLRLIMHTYSNASNIRDKSDVWTVSGTNLLRNLYMEYKDRISITTHSYVKMCPYKCIHVQTTTCKECNRVGDIPLSLDESVWKFYDWKYVKENRESFTDSYGVCVHVGNGSLW